MGRHLFTKDRMPLELVHLSQKANGELKFAVFNLYCEDHKNLPHLRELKTLKQLKFEDSIHTIEMLLDSAIRICK